MQTIIKKTALDVNNCRKQLLFYSKAREGFYEILKALKEKGEYTLLLPSYIGYSPNEGSGIYDPVTDLKIKHSFYHMDKNINIDVDDFERKVRQTTGQTVALLVHYFGYTDCNIDKVVQIARNYGAFIIEDCAHALYTDFIDQKCGSFSDVSFYSLHKMLPFSEGGMVKINKDISLYCSRNSKVFAFYDYDLANISKKRKRNAQLIEAELSGIDGLNMIRIDKCYKNCTPQTFPIILSEIDKDNFYHSMNDKGYGVVSLYHTMIEPLRNKQFDTSVKLSQSIINLPVHQDIEDDCIVNMCQEIKALCKGIS